MANDEDSNRTTILSDLVRDAQLKANLLGEPVSIFGHAESCEALAYETATDCQTCSLYDVWEENCKNGLPQTNLPASEYFEKTDFFCPEYKPLDLECSCSYESRLPIPPQDQIN